MEDNAAECCQSMGRSYNKAGSRVEGCNKHVHGQKLELEHSPVIILVSTSAMHCFDFPVVIVIRLTSRQARGSWTRNSFTKLIRA
jgi:hypothetical protein